MLIQQFKSKSEINFFFKYRDFPWNSTIEEDTMVTQTSLLVGKGSVAHRQGLHPNILFMVLLPLLVVVVLLLLAAKGPT